jgi:predicted nucleic acid-binding protein
MTPILLDTGYIIALEAADDQNHEVASNYWRSLPKPLPPLITTSYIFDEIVTFFNSRNRHGKATEVGERLLSSPSIQLVHVDQALFFNAWKLFRQRKDKSYSLTDCISFLVMKKSGCEEALSFDKHFRQEGFRILP